MDNGIIIAISCATITIVGTVRSMMNWVKTESNDLRKDAKEDRKEMVEMVRSLDFFTRETLTGIREEIKDFHSRVIEIEKARK
jgi:hypothetical protein